MKYKVGDFVTLGEHERTPRQPGVILCADRYPWGIGYVVMVRPEDHNDDGLRELTEDQIEGLIR